MGYLMHENQPSKQVEIVAAKPKSNELGSDNQRDPAKKVFLTTIYCALNFYHGYGYHLTVRKSPIQSASIGDYARLTAATPVARTSIQLSGDASSPRRTEAVR